MTTQLGDMKQELDTAGVTQQKDTSADKQTSAACYIFCFPRVLL